LSMPNIVHLSRITPVERSRGSTKSLIEQLMLI
jgi:hypothetical protein